MRLYLLLTGALLLTFTGALLSVARLASPTNPTVTGLGPVFSGLGVLLLVLTLRHGNREDD